LPRIRAQVDVIWGELDRPHYDPQLQHAVFLRYQPHAGLRILPNTGHWSMYEGAAAFNAAILDLLAKPLRA
jgi:pimeloyl-ACP methyl ester carboxylesterase